ncbi:MAG: DDE-type integrase/transposase/recombinase [Acidimicrobiales bacterium]
MNDRRHDIALFRYSLVREPADAALRPRQRGELVRELAAAEHATPWGERVVVSRNTLDRWVRAYRAGGFEALVPKPRAGVPLTPPSVLALAEALKREDPARTAAHVAEMVREAEGWAPSERTVQRLFARLGLNDRPGGRQAFGRFEADRPNELWVGDALHGPAVRGRKAILFAFLDDHSRLLPGYRWGLSEDTVRMEAALRAGMAARGVPSSLYVDNGSAFVSTQLLRACATLGVRLVHSRPRRPQGRGKIERVFATVRAQFLVEVAHARVDDMVALNRLFAAWVEGVYHRRVHSETGQAPLERFAAAGPPALPTATALHEAFLWAERRQVTKTATVSLHGNTYEVDPALVGRRVELVFDPFDLTDIEVRFGGRPMGRAVPHKVGRHTHPQARPEAAPDPAPTGIDYLGLVERRRAEELARKISYDDLPQPGPQLPGQLSFGGEDAAG